MRKSVLPVICLIMISVTAYAADSVRQDISKICSFTFPAAPQIREIPGVRDYFYTTDSCSYVVQVKPVTQKNVIHDTATLYSFYRGVVKGILRGEKGTLIGSKKVDVKGLRGEELEYVKADMKHQPVSVCLRILVLSDHLIVFAFSSPYARFIPLKNMKDRFFDSFILDGGGSAAGGANPTPPATASEDLYTTSTPVYDSIRSSLHPAPAPRELVKTNTLHFIISFAVCILLLAGTLYVLVRLRKKK